MSSEKISKIQKDLQKLEAMGKLETLGARAGVLPAALVEIMRGQRPPTAEEALAIEMAL